MNKIEEVKLELENYKNFIKYSNNEKIKEDILKRIVILEDIVRVNNSFYTKKEEKN